MNPINFSCSLSGKPRPLPNAWEHTVGSGSSARTTIRPMRWVRWAKTRKRTFEEKYIPATAFQVGFGLLTLQGVDHDHANAKRLWSGMGKPALPTEREVEQLHVASQIGRESLPWKFHAGTLHLDSTMPAHAIAAITVELPPQQPAREPGS